MCVGVFPPELLSPLYSIIAVQKKNFAIFYTDQDRYRISYKSFFPWNKLTDDDKSQPKKLFPNKTISRVIPMGIQDWTFLCFLSFLWRCFSCNIFCLCEKLYIKIYHDCSTAFTFWLLYTSHESFISKSTERHHDKNLPGIHSIITQAIYAEVVFQDCKLYCALWALEAKSIMHVEYSVTDRNMI